MPKIKSEIFDNYAKISLDSGLIKEADKKDLEKYKNSLKPRMDSNDITSIEALYGVKLDEQKYEDNIMEVAHPNAVIVSPSYDKLNGLVENNIERNNIMVNIVNKPTHGNLTNHKYAKKELIMELIRIANDMDNRNNDDLRELADNCLKKLSIT